MSQAMNPKALLRALLFCLALSLPAAHAGSVHVDCGLDQLSLAERETNCEKLLGRQAAKTTRNGSAWKLVARAYDAGTKETVEVWRDMQTNLVWGDRLAHPYDHYSAVGLGNKKDEVVNEHVCKAAEARASYAGLSGKFGLPRAAEFAQAERDGIREVLPHMNAEDFLYWTSTLSFFDDPESHNQAYVFHGNTGRLVPEDIDAGAAIRCVQRP